MGDFTDMATQTYTLATEPWLMDHAAIPQPFFRDGVDDDADLSNLLIEARIRSGDYFVTLSTELDKLAALLERDDVPESAALLRISNELTYLDKHYKLQSR